MNIKCTKCNSIVVEYYGCANNKCSNHADKDETVDIVFRKREVEDILRAIKSRIAFECNKEIEMQICSGYLRSMNILYKIADDNNLKIK